MSNLIQCSNGFVCLEGLIEFLLTLFFLFYQIISYRVILRDKSGTLVVIDRYLCLASIISTLIQTVYFAYLDTDLVLSTLRFFGLAMQVIICHILGSIIADEQQVPRVWLLAKAFLAISFVLWFWTGFVHQSTIDYNCVQIDYLLLSALGVFLALGAFYMGNIALDGMENFKSQIEAQCRGAIKLKQHTQQLEQVKIRIEQVSLMHYCGLFQFCIQFSFDLFTYIYCENKNQCTTYYNSHSFLQVGFLVIFKLLSFSTIPATIFLIFYEKNKNKFMNEEKDIEMYITK